MTFIFFWFVRALGFYSFLTHSYSLLPTLTPSYPLLPALIRYYPLLPSLSPSYSFLTSFTIYWLFGPNILPQNTFGNQIYWSPKMQPQTQEAGVELGLTQAETVSLELGRIRAKLENIIWSQKNWSPKFLFNQYFYWP